MNITVNELIELNEHMSGEVDRRSRESIELSKYAEYKRGYQDGIKRKIEDEVETDKPF